MTSRLIVKDIYTAYDKADVLDGVSLSVEPGTITCLMGSNGSGKTTLIRSILALTKPRLGHIMFGDVEITNFSTHQIVNLGIACIPEGRRVFPKLTVEENLRLGAYRERSSKVVSENLSRVYAIFPRLRERRAQHAGLLSGGEQAMVSIGRGLMCAPNLLLVDEPSLGLSPHLVSECFRVMQMVKEQGITVFLVEQNVHQSLDIADYGYVISQGKVVAFGTPKELIANPEVRAAYFGQG
jgi:branched-chain amino acid transport system ATP-binding protein